MPKNSQIVTRVSPEQKLEFLKRAQAVSMTVSEFIIFKCLSNEPPETVRTTDPIQPKTVRTKSPETESVRTVSPTLPPLQPLESSHRDHSSIYTSNPTPPEPPTPINLNHSAYTS